MHKFLTRLIRCYEGHLPAVWEGNAGRCLQCSTCVRCGTSLERHVHDWTPWEPISLACRHVKTCERCGAGIQKLIHAWCSDGKFTHRCSACGASESHTTPQESSRGCAKCGGPALDMTNQYLV